MKKQMGSEEEREAGQGGKSRVAGQQAPAVAQSTARFREGKLLGRRSRNAVMCGRDSRADPSTTSMTTSPGGRGRRRTLQPCRVGFLFKEWGGVGTYFQGASNGVFVRSFVLRAKVFGSLRVPGGTYKSIYVAQLLPST